MNEELTTLKAFENIIVDLAPHLKNANAEEIKIVETALKDTEKYKKALEIIKTKKVDVALLFYVNNADMYNRAKQFYNHHKLTQEEYELLKEVLK